MRMSRRRSPRSRPRSTTPHRWVELDALNRDYANIQSQYNAASDRLVKASTGERIEALSKGQRIGVLDAATVPDYPTRPHRLKIALIRRGRRADARPRLRRAARGAEHLGAAAGRSLRGLDITPIGAIPYMRTPSERTVSRASGWAGSSWRWSSACRPLLYAIDTYYKPLDMLVTKICESSVSERGGRQESEMGRLEEPWPRPAGNAKRRTSAGAGGVLGQPPAARRTIGRRCPFSSFPPHRRAPAARRGPGRAYRRPTTSCAPACSGRSSKPDGTDWR